MKFIPVSTVLFLFAGCLQGQKDQKSEAGISISARMEKQARVGRCLTEALKLGLATKEQNHLNSNCFRIDLNRDGIEDFVISSGEELDDSSSITLVRSNSKIIPADQVKFKHFGGPFPRVFPKGTSIYDCPVYEHDAVILPGEGASNTVFYFDEKKNKIDQTKCRSEDN